MTGEGGGGDGELRMQILVVCSGNICRSPYAEGYLRRQLAAQGKEATVISAGTLGIVGERASSETLTLARSIGVDLDAHRSQGITYDRVDEADTILVMEAAHRRTLTDLYPEIEEKIHLLSEFHPGVTDPPPAPDIFDPIGLPMEDYRRCFSLVRDSIDGFVAAQE